MLESGSQTEFFVRPDRRLTGALSTRNSYARIVAAARDMLLAHPGSSFTVQEVADVTHLSRRAIYNHFPNPEALYRASLRDMLDELADVAGIDLDKECAPERAIGEFTRFAAGLLSSEVNLLIWAAIIRDDDSSNWLATAYARLVRQPLVRSVEIYLLHRRIRDALDMLDPQRAAEQLVGMIEAACVTPSLLKTGRYLHDDEVQFIVTSFLCAHFGRTLDDDGGPPPPGSR